MDQTKKILYQSAFRQIRKDEFKDSTDIITMSQWKRQRSLVLKDEMLSSYSYSPHEIYHLQNKWMEKRRAKLFEDERHSIDTSVETLALLNLIIYNKNEIETKGISITGLVSLGHYLREKGNHVDFVKLDRFIMSLLMRHTASMIGSLLVDVLGFEKAEVPFLYHKQRRLENILIYQYAHQQDESLLAQSKSLIRTSPLSVLTFWVKKAKTALTNIEE